VVCITNYLSFAVQDARRRNASFKDEHWISGSFCYPHPLQWEDDLDELKDCITARARQRNENKDI
jgi:hypothetical protein